jgi:hypothetical protein
MTSSLSNTLWQFTGDDGCRCGGASAADIGPAASLVRLNQVKWRMVFAP